jgi:hypothetical protein
MTLFPLPLIISNYIMKSNKEKDLSDSETIISKPNAPRKIPTNKDNCEVKLERKYLLLSKHSIADIKKAYLPQYKILGSLLKEKMNIPKLKTEKSSNNDNLLQTHQENIPEDKPQNSEIQVALSKQSHVNNYFKSSKARKLIEIEKTLDEKIRPSSKKRKINKINFNYK